MTYGAALRDLLGSLHTLASTFARPDADLAKVGVGPGADTTRTAALAQITRLRTPVVRAAARMTMIAAEAEAAHAQEVAYAQRVDEAARRKGARVGAARALAVRGQADASTLGGRIARSAAASATAELVRRTGVAPSPDRVAALAAERAAARVAAHVAAHADLSAARALAPPAPDLTSPRLLPTPLAAHARELDALTSGGRIPVLADGDLLAGVIPLVAAWQDTARASILLAERELPALGPLTVEQAATLTGDAALVRDVLTHLGTRFAPALHAARVGPWAPLPTVPVDASAPRAGLDHLGFRAPATPTRPPSHDGVGETLWALGTLTGGLRAATPHARAAADVAAALTRISDHAATIGTHTTWSSRAGALDALWLALQDVHSGAGAQQATPLAQDAAASLAAVDTLALDQETRLGDAVDAATRTLLDVVDHAIRTRLYTVVVGVRPGPVVRTTRTLHPVHAFATPDNAPDLHHALDAVAALPPRDTSTRHMPGHDATAAREQLTVLLATLAEATAPPSSTRLSPTHPASMPSPVARVYAAVRARVADGTYAGALPSPSALAHRHNTTTAVARDALARLAGDGIITISPARQGATAPASPGEPVTWATVYRELRARIEDGTYRGRLPSTKALAAEFGVTTTVVHTAAAALARDGLVQRVRGPHGGTFTRGTRPPDPTPRWRAVHDDLAARIADGRLTGRLPTTRALANEYGTSASTVHQATVALTAEGLLVPRHGGPRAGIDVAAAPSGSSWRRAHDDVAARIRDGSLAGRLDSPATLARAYDVDPADAAHAVAQLVDEGLVRHQVSGNRRGLFVVPRAGRHDGALWRTIYTDLRAGIEDGTYAGRLPSRRDIATRYGSSTGAPGQAMRQLVKDGLVVTVTGTGPTAGAYVAGHTPPPTPTGATWRTVYEEIRTRIDDGTYTGRLPTVGTLAATHHTTRAPAYKALRALAATGRVATHNDGATSGTYVVSSGHPPARTTRWRIYDDLRQRVTTHGADRSLPTATELAREYGTSRKPVAFALARLADEGLIERRHHPHDAVGRSQQPGAIAPHAGPSV
ncbi:GntR family transcriptional regulator [Xylanimonas ulmi]|uniref:Regulatory GntR family protein n=1 Tax=Xylanimonas ulmi TaxID=228973 RepID=A0A4Q7M3V2_9MICO|nr:GntR family transcriptional regulator [Xylanibacterium ulmi]RZS60639.1 regulatory GntR family protein [Xylanibacterium ulmi]